MNSNLHPSTKIPWAKPSMRGRESDYIQEALNSTWISGGPFIERLEREFSTYCNAKFALAVSNGTTAIHLAFLGLKLKPGDEVIVPGFGFMAAANIAIHMNLKPVFVDVDSATWCMDGGRELEKAISAKTKAIVPVHTYGAVCNMNSIMEIAASRGIAVIEDAAESFPSKYKGKLSGTIGTIGCYSFQATKMITTGEGGMVVTDNKDLYERMCLYRSHGMSRRRYWHEVPGHNFRLTNLQAAMGCAQLEQLDTFVRERQRVHNEYKTALSNVGGITLQHFSSDVDAVLWAMACTLDPTVFPQGRDQVISQLALANIETRPGFYAASFQPIYQTPPLPISESISNSVISLPTYPDLTNSDINRICRDLSKLKAGG